MKSLLFIFIISVGLYPTYESTTATQQPSDSEKEFVLTDSINFTQQVQPILVSRCSPCHFTGGKMYAKMPFDNPATILKPEFKNGLLKRIKDEKENVLLKQFIETNTQ